MAMKRPTLPRLRRGTGAPDPGLEEPTRLRAAITRRSNSGPRLQEVRQRLEERREAVAAATQLPDPDVLVQQTVATSQLSGRTPAQPQSEVPWGVRVAAEWGWRLLIIVASVVLLVWASWQVHIVLFPLVVAVLLAAMLEPLTAKLRGWGLSSGPAAAITVFGLLGIIVIAGAFVGDQVQAQFTDVTTRASQGFAEVQQWLEQGPLKLTEQQLAELVDRSMATLRSNQAMLAGRAIGTATAAAEIIAGIGIALFALFFFLYDGGNIWAWLVRLLPRTSRVTFDQAGRLAGLTLRSYVRGTAMVAITDAVFIGLYLKFLGVPLAVGLATIVFFGAFIPMVGAFISGGMAMLVALVLNGPVTALLVLAGIIAIQQLESHFFQPFVLGRMVRVHPLAVVLVIAIGGYLGGIIGAVIAVPTAAVVNTVGKYLAGVHAAEAELAAPTHRK